MSRENLTPDERYVLDPSKPVRFANEPLDLHAVEKRLLTVSEDGRGVTLEDVAALLAALRETRAIATAVTPMIREHLDRLKDIALATGDFDLISQLQMWAVTLDGAAMAHDALRAALLARVRDE